MTLETLVKIIIEAIDKVMAAERQIVLGIRFCKSNDEKLKKAVGSINSSGTVAYFENGLPDYLPDILFLDYLPVKFVPEIALGLTYSPFAEFISNMLSAGKQIIVIGYGPVMPDTTPAAYSALLSSYYKMIGSYGVKFDPSYCSFNDGYTNPPAVGTNNECAPAANNVYNGNVLSRQDLLANAKNGQITIGKSVVVTALALDEGKLRNIKINRL